MRRTVKSDNVKPYGRISKAGVATKKVRGGPAKLALLSSVDRVGGGGEASLCAKPHFDKNDCGLVLHDKINLTMPTTKIALDQAEAFGL